VVLGAFFTAKNRTMTWAEAFLLLKSPDDLGAFFLIAQNSPK
jgi:hypothetical protein